MPLPARPRWRASRPPEDRGVRASNARCRILRPRTGQLRSSTGQACASRPVAPWQRPIKIGFNRTPRRYTRDHPDISWVRPRLRPPPLTWQVASLGEGRRSDTSARAALQRPAKGPRQPSTGTSTEFPSRNPDVAGLATRQAKFFELYRRFFRAFANRPGASLERPRKGSPPAPTTAGRAARTAPGRTTQSRRQQ